MQNGKVGQAEYKTHANGSSKVLRMPAEKITFEKDNVEIKPQKQKADEQNPIQKAVETIKEAVT